MKKITNKDEAFEYLVKNKSGSLKKLEKDISLDLIKMFDALGFIKRGFETDNTESWKVTKAGEEEFYFFKEKYNNIKNEYSNFIELKENENLIKKIIRIFKKLYYENILGIKDLKKINFS